MPNSAKAGRSRDRLCRWDVEPLAARSLRSAWTATSPLRSPSPIEGTGHPQGLCASTRTWPSTRLMCVINWGKELGVTAHASDTDARNARRRGCHCSTLGRIQPTTGPMLVDASTHAIEVDFGALCAQVDRARLTSGRVLRKWSRSRRCWPQLRLELARRRPNLAEKSVQMCRSKSEQASHPLTRVFRESASHPSNDPTNPQVHQPSNAWRSPSRGRGRGPRKNATSRCIIMAQISLSSGAAATPRARALGPESADWWRREGLGGRVRLRRPRPGCATQAPQRATSRHGLGHAPTPPGRCRDIHTHPDRMRAEALVLSERGDPFVAAAAAGTAGAATRTLPHHMAAALWCVQLTWGDRVPLGCRLRVASGPLESRLSGPSACAAREALGSPPLGRSRPWRRPSLGRPRPKFDDVALRRAERARMLPGLGSESSPEST